MQKTPMTERRRGKSAIRMLAGLAIVAGTACTSMAEADNSQDAKLEMLRETDQQVMEGPAENFTGRATIKGFFAREKPSRVTGATVTFEPGARTAWHSHPLGQTLIVTDGTGWTQVEGDQKYEFQAGDIMLCPKNKKHWHGATPDSSMTHIAIQERLEGSNVVWLEKVTDEEYLAGTPITD